GAHRERHAADPLFALVPLVPPHRRRLDGSDVAVAREVQALAPAHEAQRAAHALGLGEPLRRGPYGSLRPPAVDGRRKGHEDRLMAGELFDGKYELHEHDVIVIGAGGAGLRAAIEASAKGANTALICKSLLGKAHTVMAEGGIAAALANVYPEDNWKV